MKNNSAMRWLLIVAMVVSLAAGLEANAVYAEPLLVMQPAYVGMRFYVHQPQGIPTNWYATFDGYPVWKGAEGVWFYGSYSNNAIIQTNYIVGSVVPSLVGIYPYVAQPAALTTMQAPVVQTQVVATMPTPVVQTQVVATTAPVVTQAVTTYPVPAVVAAPAVVTTPTIVATPVAVTAVVPAGYGIDPSFMALSTWRGNVDRVGILAKPSIPVAWKGMSPQVLYAWTGSRWYQMTARDGDRPGDILRPAR